MRKETNQALKVLKNVEILEKSRKVDLHDRQLYKIITIKCIQQNVTVQYKNVMKDICQYCENVLGSPPCKSAVVGMGSLAREEITPYSDFEHIILLEVQANNEHLEYYRWFSVIFHTLILNLQETIIPSLNIMYLNDKTCELGDWFFDSYTSGVSFDGMMPHACKFPLGRSQFTERKPWKTELIKPVNEMVEYLSSDISLKNGYHLSDILMQTCFIYGDQNVHEEFEKAIQLHKNSITCHEAIENIGLQVKEDLDRYATRLRLTNLKTSDKLNVKQMFYRTSTLFVVALAKLCETKSSSCFDIIHKLAEQKKISHNTEHKLSYAIAIACEIRLRIYMDAKSQRDYIGPCKNAEKIFGEILEIISLDSIISFFQITYCLQNEVIKLLGIKENYIYTNPCLINITICYALKQNELMLSLLRNYDKAKDLELNKSDVQTSASYESKDNSIVRTTLLFSFFDNCLDTLENEIVYCKAFAKKQSKQANAKTIVDNLCYFFDTWNDKTDFSELLELLKWVLEIFQAPTMKDEERKEISREVKMDVGSWICCIRLFIAFFLVELNQFTEASELVNQTVDSCTNENHDVKYNSALYFAAGNIYFKMKEYENFINCLQASLASAISIGFDKSKCYKIMITYGGIGICFLKLDLLKYVF